ncbi:hypothetical protein CEV31_4298 [Brucella thiophenivorans]|uniref:Uncharacterized protein n=1 Tax=Brucella thiophenivorans TaxID=571255 RepID=A0A256FU96_9HYPH|nr:hypothetical protein CEV31_4298 [Brucella thiophenivorans]
MGIFCNPAIAKMRQIMITLDPSALVAYAHTVALDISV